MLGFLLIFHLIQYYSDWTRAELSSALSPPVKSLHELMAPWDFVFGPNAEEGKVCHLASEQDTKDNDNSCCSEDSSPEPKFGCGNKAEDDDMSISPTSSSVSDSDKHESNDTSDDDDEEHCRHHEVYP